jgi:hypothetical protein
MRVLLVGSESKMLHMLLPFVCLVCCVIRDTNSVQSGMFQFLELDRVSLLL